jgi:hypothetical protein
VIFTQLKEALDIYFTSEHQKEVKVALKRQVEEKHRADAARDVRNAKTAASRAIEPPRRRVPEAASAASDVNHHRASVSHRGGLRSWQGPPPPANNHQVPLQSRGVEHGRGHDRGDGPRPRPGQGPGLGRGAGAHYAVRPADVPVRRVEGHVHRGPVEVDVVVSAPVVVPAHDNRADGVSVERMLVIAAQREDEELRRRSNTHANDAHNPP